MSPRLSNRLALLAALLLSACSAGQADDGASLEERDSVGLFTTLPIYWGEGADISSILSGGGETDWVRSLIESRFDITPLDALEPETIEGTGRIIMAQPRPLAPSENAALDNWVRAGGRLLVFADPMLTRHSEFGIGDKRRQQDVVVLSPILGRLGVRLLFDEEQPQSERLMTVDGHQYPVQLAGRFEPAPTGSVQRVCSVAQGGLLAHCSNGRGEAFLYADAALLDWESDDPVPASRRKALGKLMQPLVSKGASHRQN